MILFFTLVNSKKRNKQYNHGLQYHQIFYPFLQKETILLPATLTSETQGEMSDMLTIK